MDTVRIFLHVLAASVWVGGLLVLLGLLPTARGISGDAQRQLAAAFNRIVWPAFALVVVTGMWSLVLIPLDELDHLRVGLKVLAVALSGAGAAVHQFAGRNRLLQAGGGAASSLFGVLAMYLGVLMGPNG